MMSDWSSNLTINSSPVAGNAIQWKLSRDTADTLTGDVEIWGIEIEYTAKRLGSLART